MATVSMQPDKPETYLPFAVFIVKKYFYWAYRDRFSFDDLVSEGLVHIIRTLKKQDRTKWNPEISSQSYFLSVCIRRHIQSYLRKYKKWNDRHTLASNEVLTYGKSLPRPAYARNDLPEVTFKQAIEYGSCLTRYQKGIYSLLLQGKQGAEIARLLGLNRKYINQTIRKIRSKIKEIYGDPRIPS